MPPKVNRHPAQNAAHMAQPIRLLSRMSSKSRYAMTETPVHANAAEIHRMVIHRIGPIFIRRRGSVNASGTSFVNIPFSGSAVILYTFIRVPEPCSAGDTVLEPCDL